MGEQFRRFFPLAADFTPPEMNILVSRYKVQGEKNLVNYLNLHNEITDAVSVVKDAPIPVSPYFVPDEITNETWTKSKYGIVERVTAKVIEMRVRLQDSFSDFDNLRTGFCTDHNVDSVLTSCGLKFPPEEVEELKSIYGKKDLNLRSFNYKRFCDEVSKATNYANIHKDPLARISLPSSDVTLPGRRSRRELTEQDKSMIAEIETEIRSRVAKRRINVCTQFQDFDRSRQGHVTCDQFKRVLASLQIDGGKQDNTQTDLLAKKYCDLGDGKRDLFNYRTFCAVVDPVANALKLAEKQSKQPYVNPAPSRYFTEVGKVFDVTDGQYQGM